MYARVHMVASWIRSVASTWGELLTTTQRPSSSPQATIDDAPAKPQSPPESKVAKASQLCPPNGKWHVVQWMLHVPYDSGMWEQSLMEAARGSMGRRLRGSEQYPGLVRLKELAVTDEDVEPWGKEVASACPGPMLTAQFWCAGDLNPTRPSQAPSRKLSLPHVVYPCFGSETMVNARSPKEHSTLKPRMSPGSAS